MKPEGIAEANWNDYAKSKAKLSAYFTPESCNDFAVFELINTKMRGDENVANYTLRLREAAQKCDFTGWNANKMIKALLISNMRDEQLRLKLLQKDRTLEEVLTISRKKEDALARDKVMDRQREGGSDSTGVKKLGGMWPNKRPEERSRPGRDGRPEERSRPGRDGRPEERKTGSGRPGKDDACSYCGYEMHDKRKCPATDKECSRCNKTGHFAKMCRSIKKPVKKVDVKQQEDSDYTTDSDGECMMISVLNIGGKTPLMRVKVNGTEMLWQPDTGTRRNLMDENHLKLFEEKHGKNVTLVKSNACLYPYGSNEKLTVVGKFEAKFEAGEKEVKDVIYVTKEESEHPLISEDTAINLGLVTYNQEFIVNNVTHVGKRRIDEGMKSEFPELFTGRIGKSKSRQVKIMIDENVIPVAQRSRRIAVNLTEKAEGKMKQLMREDIIERYPDDEPRGWINPNVFAPKPNGDIRFCLDMRLANTAVLRPYTTIPTMAEVEAKFSGQKDSVS